MVKKIIGNKKIEITEIQDDRFWFHSKKLGYGKWIYNSELRELIKTKIRCREENHSFVIKTKRCEHKHCEKCGVCQAISGCKKLITGGRNSSQD